MRKRNENMKKFISLLACAVAFAATSIAFADDEKFIINFAPGTDIKTEIANANAFLAAGGSSAVIDDEYEATANGLVFELSDEDPAALKALVETYFPADANVLNVNYFTENEDENEVADMNEDSNSTSGADVTARVRLAKPAPAGGTKVLLASSNPKLATVPAFVMVPAGKTSATFKIHPAKKVAKTAVVKIASKASTKTAVVSLTVKKH